MRYLVVVLVALVGSGIAVADDESDRNELLKNIDDKVGRIADELSGFASDSDVGDADDALSYAREVAELVSRLDRVKGSDSRAQRVVSYYPGYVSQFRDATRSLKKQKELQRLADALPDRCSSAESNLQSEIRRYVGDLDSSAADEGPAKISEMGKNLGRTWGEAMRKLREQDNEMKNAASNTRFSVSEDKWSSVSSNLGSSASGMLDYWNDKVRAAVSKCERLEQGEKHPDIEKALATLGSHAGSTKGTVTQLKRDFNAWLREVRQLRKFSDEDRDAVRNAFCTAGEYEMESKANDIADRWASQISSVYGSIMGQGDRLRSKATTKEMAKYKGPKEVVLGVDKNLANLAKLKGYELAGSNNPTIRARIEWGKKRHEDLQRSCTYYEADVSSSYCSNAIRSGSNCRLDCIKGCKVIEFKPDNSAAKSEGQTQVQAYRAGLIKWYASSKVDLLKAFPELARCESSDKTKLELDIDVVTYEMCSGTVKDQLGQRLDEATLDLSETPE